MKSKSDKNKGGGRRPNENSVRLGDLLSPGTQALLKRTRDGLPEGWGELFCLPGEIVMSVVADGGGTVYCINGILAFSGGDKPDILQAGFRSPKTGEWLDALPRARTKFLSKQKRPAALMALPIDNVDLVPANAPEGTKETSLKIRWVADGSIIIYSLDREKFSREQPWFHRDMKRDPMFHWLERAMETLGKEMLLSATAKYADYATGLEPNFAKTEAAKPAAAPVQAEDPKSDWDAAASDAPAGTLVAAFTLDDFAGTGGVDGDPTEEELQEIASETVPGEVNDLNLKPLALSIPGTVQPGEHKFADLPVETGETENAWDSVEAEEEVKA